MKVVITKELGNLDKINIFAENHVEEFYLNQVTKDELENLKFMLTRNERSTFDGLFFKAVEKENPATNYMTALMNVFVDEMVEKTKRINERIRENKKKVEAVKIVAEDNDLYLPDNHSINIEIRLLQNEFDSYITAINVIQRLHDQIKKG